MRVDRLEREDSVDEKVIRRIKELEDELSELKGNTVSTVEFEVPIYNPTKISSFEPRNGERIVKVLLVVEKNSLQD